MWKDELKGDRLEPLLIDQELDGVRLRGELGPFINEKQILFRCVKATKGKDRIRTWLRHLFLSAFQEHGMETRFYSLDKKFISLQPLPRNSARSIISNLIRLYKRGMLEPLPFFPDTSYAFACNQSSDPKEEENKEDKKN